MFEKVLLTGALRVEKKYKKQKKYIRIVKCILFYFHLSTFCDEMSITLCI